MSHKQLVEVCNFPASINELDLVKTNWLPICVNGTDTWYVAETSTFNNSTGIENTPVKIYKQGANGAISLTAPVGTITEGYCSVSSTLVLTENSSQNRIVGAQALGATINTNPTFAGARDVTVYNQYNVTVAFEYTTTNNATFHRVNIPRGGTFSNILKRDDYTNEGTYTAGRIIFAYTAGAVGPVATPNEINIDWTT